MSTKVTMENQVNSEVKQCSDAKKKELLIEEMVEDMNSLEQFVDSVINYSSKYNISFSISYSPDNLVGSNTIYPRYGDYPETYSMRTYGNWWKESEAYQQEYMPQEKDPLGVEDYVTLGFGSAVAPRDICIYETYNPGAIVRIWGRYSKLNWKLLWEGQPQTCTPGESRKFCPKINKLNCLINELRLEFNQSHLEYHTALDAVLLGGFEPKKSILQQFILQSDLEKWTCFDDKANEEETGDDNSDNEDMLSNLPHEIILHIFQYLDLKSLSRCGLVNKRWNKATQDPILYQNLTFKRYWHLLTGDNFCYFIDRCQNVRKVDLSWCGNDDKSFSDAFLKFLHTCCQQLTHLSLCSCDFVNSDVISIIPLCQELTELRLVNAQAESVAFRHLANLKKLVTLDVSNTKIMDDAVIAISRANPDLKHLLLDFCERIEHIDKIIETVSEHNINLTVWSSFKTMSMTSAGGMHFAKCNNLLELDLGWCFLLTHPGDCLKEIAENCFHLKRLVITQWRGVTDQMLTSLSKLKNLTQLDLLGTKNVPAEVFELLLLALPKLRLLDVSFCGIPTEKIRSWKQNFPEVTIHSSAQ